MDSSGRELQQICLMAKSNFEINRTILKWLEEGAEINPEANLCKVNRCLESDFKTAFNCLLNSYHTTEIHVEKILRQHNYKRERFIERQRNIEDNGASTVHTVIDCANQMISPFSLFYQDSKGITALHLAVYRNSLHVDKIAKLLLNWCRHSEEFLSSDNCTNEVSLASIPMACGSYPLHILTGQNLTIKEELLETLLRADSSIPFKDDVNGDNPISLLWKNTLRFRWAISVMEGASFIDYIKNDDCAWMAVITPCQFIRFSLLMAEAALQEHDDGFDTEQDKVETIHDLCRIPRCPPMLLRLLQSPEYSTLFGISGSAHSFDEHGMLPIHHAVQNPPVTFKFVPSSLKSCRQKSLVEILLEENPAGVRVADVKGRLPLHYALDSGCISGKDILELVRLYPSSLRIEDPKTGLYPFMLVSNYKDRTAKFKIHQPVVSEKEEEQKLLNLRQRNPASAINSTIYEAAGRYHSEWKTDHVQMTYMLLMLCPDAIHFPTSV